MNLKFEILKIIFLGRKPLNKWHMAIYQQICPSALMTFMHLCLWAFIFAFGGWRFLFFLMERLKAFVFALGGWSLLYLLLKRLKVFVVSFEWWRFLLLCFYVKGYYSYSWMFKILTFGFKCSKFFLLLLDIENSYFYS